MNNVAPNLTELIGEFVFYYNHYIYNKVAAKLIT